MNDEIKTFWSTGDFKSRITDILPPEENKEWILGNKEDRFQGSSIELSLGEEAFISSEKKLKRLNEKENHIKISPGDFAILITDEYIKIPPHCMGFISIKNRYKIYGLINISGFHVDPGFEGKLKFSVYNAGTADVLLKYKDPIFILFITYTTNNDVKLYKKGHEHWRQQHIEPKEMMPLLGAGIPIHDITHRLRTVETAVKIYGGILIGILILLLKMAFSG
jgi:dCTP deaminase